MNDGPTEVILGGAAVVRAQLLRRAHCCLRTISSAPLLAATADNLERWQLSRKRGGQPRDGTAGPPD